MLPFTTPFTPATIYFFMVALSWVCRLSGLSFLLFSFLSFEIPSCLFPFDFTSATLSAFVIT
jgi:hypothetical protein